MVQTHAGGICLHGLRHGTDTPSFHLRKPWRKPATANCTLSITAAADTYCCHAAPPCSGPAQQIIHERYDLQSQKPKRRLWWSILRQPVPAAGGAAGPDADCGGGDGRGGRHHRSGPPTRRWFRYTSCPTTCCCFCCKAATASPTRWPSVPMALATPCPGMGRPRPSVRGSTPTLNTNTA